MDLSGMPTLLDLAKQRGNDIQVGLIEENIKVMPEFGRFPMRTIAGTAYKTLVRTGIPTARFRKANQGVPRSKSTFEQRLTECFILDTQIAADKAIADVWEPGGAAAYQMIEASGTLEAVSRRVAQSIYYGNGKKAVAANLGDALGFPGFIDSYDTEHQVSGGATANLTSVWGVRFGIKDVHLISGGNTLPNIMPEWRIQSVQVEDNAAFTAYVNSLMGWLGMQVGASYSLVRIANIGTADGTTLTDSLGEAALEKLPSGIVPDVFFMNRRSRKQLRESRQTVAANGGVQPNAVPTPTDLAGIPIITTDAIVNNEEVLA